MRPIRTTTGVDNLLNKPEITLLYRDNSLYRAISKEILRMLNQLGYKTHHRILDGHASREKIREVARNILSPHGGGALVLPDHTCWRVTTTEPGLEHLRYPFEHLDTILSEAAITSMYERTSIPPSSDTIDISIEVHFEAIANIFAFIKEGGFRGNCHVVQTEIAEHSPFVIKLIKHLMPAGVADIFPPVRAVLDTAAIPDADEREKAIANAEVVSRLCDYIEEPLAARVAETISRAGIRTVLHQKEVLSLVHANDIVVCDIHHLKRFEAQMAEMTVLPLPLASLIAQACEHNLLPVAIMTKLRSNVDAILSQRHQKLVERAKTLAETKAI